MGATNAELVHVRYQKLNNIHFSVMDITAAARLHEHSCLEVGLVLQGSVLLQVAGRERRVDTGGLLLFNAYDSHALSSEAGAKVLFAQLAPGFGKAYFARIASVEFDTAYMDALPTHVTTSIRHCLLSAAKAFFEESEIFGMECAGWLAHMVVVMLRGIPYTLSSDAEVLAKKKKTGRYQRIASYMERHYREKLTLSHLARAEGITAAYMSRIFGELFNQSFQEYISELRLNKAIPLLKNPDMYLVDVCMECGFSDTRYLNAVCQKRYGCPAAVLRKRLIQGEFVPADNGEQANPEPQYSDAEALIFIDNYLKHKEER